jgi:hypothetical protein
MEIMGSDGARRRNLKPARRSCGTTDALQDFEARGTAAVGYAVMLKRHRWRR